MKKTQAKNDKIIKELKKFRDNFLQGMKVWRAKQELVTQGKQLPKIDFIDLI